MTRSYVWARRLVWATAAVVASVGCNPASLSYFLFKGDGKAPAQYPLQPKDDKKEVTLAVLVTAPTAGTDYDFAGLDRDLTAAVGRAFAEPAKDKKAVVKVIDQGKLDRFKMANPGWKTMKAADIGRELGADYVLDVTVNSAGLYEPGTGRLMYMGQAHVDAVVYDAATGAEHSRYFVNTRLDTRPADAMPKPQYKAQLIQRIATELSWKHLPHVTDQRVPGQGL